VTASIENSFPSFAEKRKVSIGQGNNPVWTKDGKLFYRSDDDVMEVEIRTGRGITIGKRQTFVSTTCQRFAPVRRHRRAEIPLSGRCPPERAQ
jgi:hypothetical protein